MCTEHQTFRLVNGYQEIIGTYRFATSLELSPDAAVFGVGGHIQRQNIKPFNDGV
jgi:hypothetical protein